MSEKLITRREVLKSAGLAALSIALGGCGRKQQPPQESIKLPNGSTYLPDGKIVLPNGSIVMPNGTVIPSQSGAVTPQPGGGEGQATPTPTTSPTPEPGGGEGQATPTPTSLMEREEAISQLPYFSVEGASPNIIIASTSDWVANNGPDKAGNDHQNPFFPQSAAWVVCADPGHYRVNNLSNVTDPDTRASIERDIGNGTAFAGDDYKTVLTSPESQLPLWEAGGGAVLTGAQMGIVFHDGEGNPVRFQLGRRPNHSWVAVLTNGLPRDHTQGTDNNRSIEVTNYDPSFVMWQGIPRGLFVSAQFVAQTVADAHGSYRDRGTSPGQGQDGVENVSILFAKILPNGEVAYSVLRHNHPNTPWNSYQPDQFAIVASNTTIR